MTTMTATALLTASGADPDAPADVREVLARILPQEEFHERAFRAFASDEDLTAVKCRTRALCRSPRGRGACCSAAFHTVVDD